MVSIITWNIVPEPLPKILSTANCKFRKTGGWGLHLATISKGLSTKVCHLGEDYLASEVSRTFNFKKSMQKASDFRRGALELYLPRQ